MVLLRSAPREVYRIYSEEDYLACKDLSERADATIALAPDLDTQELEHPRWAFTPHRVPIAAVLALACGLLGVLLGLQVRVDARVAAPAASVAAGRVSPRPLSRSRSARAAVRAPVNVSAHARPVSRGPALAARRPLRARAARSREPAVAVKSAPLAHATRSADATVVRGDPAPGAAPSARPISTSRRAVNAEAEFGFER